MQFRTPPGQQCARGASPPDHDAKGHDPRDAYGYLCRQVPSLVLSLTLTLTAQADEQEPRLQAYAERWLAHRAGLRPRTIELYSWLRAAS